MVVDNTFEDYLINDNVVNYLYIDKIYRSNSNYYYKEKYNDRFYILYEKNYSSSDMTNGDYKFAGYYDAIDRVLYNPSYDIASNVSLLKNPKNIKVRSLGELSKDIEQDVIIFIKNYCQNNANKLKKEIKDKFVKQEKYTFDSYISYVNNEFVNSRIDNYVSIPDYSGKNFYEQEFCFSNNQIYTEYLNNPIETVLRIGEYLTNNADVKEDLGIMLLKNDYQNDYLKEIIINKNGKFNNLYLNKKILNCLENIEAVNFNITIEYDNHTLSFKYPKSTLVRDLEMSESNSNTYGKSYEIVEEFLDKYKKSDNSWHKHSFDFENITSITYGKNILYEKENSKEKENILEEEMEK